MACVMLRLVDASCYTTFSNDPQRSTVQRSDGHPQPCGGKLSIEIPPLTHSLPLSRWHRPTHPFVPSPTDRPILVSEQGIMQVAQHRARLGSFLRRGDDRPQPPWHPVGKEGWTTRTMMIHAHADPKLSPSRSQAVHVRELAAADILDASRRLRNPFIADSSAAGNRLLSH